MRSGGKASSRRTITSRSSTTRSSSRLLAEGGFELGQRFLDAPLECILEVDAVAQIAQQIGHRGAAGLVEEPARGERAGGISKLRVATAQFRKRGRQPP